jgi:predicted amidohydrolase
VNPRTTRRPISRSTFTYASRKRSDMTSRRITVSAAQLGPVPLSANRPKMLARFIKLLEGPAADGARLVVFPEAALTPFFPHRLVEDPDQLGGFYEYELPEDPEPRRRSFSFVCP